MNAPVSGLGIRAGHCSACGLCIWRTATLQREAWGLPAGQVFLLWPLADSLYAQLWTPTGHAPGIAYCQACAPEISQPGPLFDGAPVIGYETAGDRYANWYADERAVFYRDWFRDALFLDAMEIERLMQQWEIDRSGRRAV